MDASQVEKEAAVVCIMRSGKRKKLFTFCYALCVIILNIFRLPTSDFRLPLIALAITGCSGREDSENKSPAEFENEKIIRDFTLVETEGEEKKWVMDAESAQFKEINGENVLEIKEFTVRFFKDNKETAFLKARAGIYNKQTESLKTTGEVEIETEGKKIVTKNVVWDPAKQLFVTEEEVIINTEEGVLRGKGMEASMDLKKINIKNEIKGEFEE